MKRSPTPTSNTQPHWYSDPPEFIPASGRFQKYHIGLGSGHTWDAIKTIEIIMDNRFTMLPATPKRIDDRQAGDTGKIGHKSLWDRYGGV